MNSSARGAALILGMLAAVSFGLVARADDGVLPVVRFHDGRFEPEELVVKAQTPVRLRVVNDNRDAIEFESFELNRERVVLPGSEIVVFLPALDAGSYKFFDDFHHGAGEGTITAK